jgi:hypothetical protein
VPPLGNLFDSVYLQTEVCYRSQLDAAMGSDSDRVDEVRSTAAIIGKALTGDIMARIRLEVSPVHTPSREPDKVHSIYITGGAMLCKALKTPLVSLVMSSSEAETVSIDEGAGDVTGVRNAAGLCRSHRPRS